jgi:hypothetical protein
MVTVSGGAVQRTMQSHADTPDLGQTQHLAVQCCTAVLAHLRIGEAVVTVLALKARVAGLLTRLHATEEGGKRLVQAVQHIL